MSIDDEFRKHLDEVKLRGLRDEDEWLDAAVEEGSLNEPTSWTSHHEAKACDKENICTINVPEPLLNYKSSAIELQYHLMKTAVEYTQFLNPGQIAVGRSDLPLYVLKKTIQLAFPNEFGSNYFCFMGGLHIEQAVLVCIGHLITGTRLEDIITNATSRRLDTQYR